MYCQRCQMHPASRQVMDPQGHPHFLCEGCATQVAVFGTLQKMLLPALMKPNLPAQQSCPSCHNTWQELNQLSHLGCPDCYRHFRLALESSLTRLHGQTVHTGRRPAQPAPTPHDPAEELRKQLEQAVAEERYEDAARLRDELKGLS